ncbi:MAG: tetratricopeptide repeat protein [Metallibacterium scheffleri]|uniref:tetratricopeptide repeat protein n=1 Tax=Metallibacterium scheffleri TaxID=993689 RepID=UPI0026F0B6ED|nr:tetratricopeptide repeat protein [Metallibacterium scheffleri]MCK9366471.1 tetratricopeptide repeat protein [Metallibacterium scheffleri]
MKVRSLPKFLLLLVLALTAVGAASARGDKNAPEYPNTKREQPKNDLRSEREQRMLQAGFNALNKNDDAKATDELNKVLKDSSSKYAKAMALRGLAQVQMNAGNNAAAVPLLQQSLDLNSLPNNDYFNTMLTIAQLQAQDEQWQPALATLQKWMTEGGKQSGDAYALEGNIYYRLNQYQNAIGAMKQALALKPDAPDSWNQLLMASYFGLNDYAEAAKLEEAVVAKNPNDKAAVKNLVSVYIQAKEPDKALKVMAAAKARGLYTSNDDYINLAKMYLYIGQNQDNPKPDALQAAGVVQDGLSKNIVTPSLEAYKLLGDAYYAAGEQDKAMAAWTKASPYAKDGEMDFLRGQLLIQDQKFTEGRSLMQTALKRGVKRVGAAWALIGNADLALKDRKAAMTAFEKAAQDPETHAAAEKVLKQLRGGRK